jgi:hypothetical protein
LNRAEDLDLLYSFILKTIACTFTVYAGPKTPPPFGDDDGYYYAKTITGTVKDEKGQPLSGATVSTKDAAQTTLTDVNGSFKLTVGDDATTLVVSFVGAETKEITIGSSGTVQVQLTNAK